MTTRLIKQVINKDGKISKKSHEVDYVERKLWEAELRAHMRCIRNLDARITLHSLVFWLMALCIGILVILEVL